MRNKSWTREVRKVAHGAREPRQRSGGLTPTDPIRYATRADSGIPLEKRGKKRAATHGAGCYEAPGHEMACYEAPIHEERCDEAPGHKAGCDSAAAPETQQLDVARRALGCDPHEMAGRDVEKCFYDEDRCD